MAHTLGVGPATSNGVGLTSLGVTINATTAGRSLVALCWFVDPTATLSSVSCSGESNLTLIGALQAGTIGGTRYGMQIAYLSNNTGGGNKTVTMTLSESGNNLGICAIEYAGGDTSAWYDSAEAGGTGNSSTPSVNLTTNTDSALIVGLEVNGSGDPTPGSGYTAITLPNIYWYEDGQYDLDVGAAGSKTFNFTLGGAADWVLKCAAFKVPGAAGRTTRNTHPWSLGIELGMRIGMPTT